MMFLEPLRSHDLPLTDSIVGEYSVQWKTRMPVGTRVLALTDGLRISLDRVRYRWIR